MGIQGDCCDTAPWQCPARFGLPLRDLSPDEGDRVGRRRDGGEERVRDAGREGVDAEHLVQGVAAELRRIRDEVGGRRDRADLLLQLDRVSGRRVNSVLHHRIRPENGRVHADVVQLVDRGGPPHVGSVRQQLAAHEHQVERRLFQNLEAHQQVVRHHGHAARVEGPSHLETRRPRIDEHGLSVEDALRHGRADRPLLRAVRGILQELLGITISAGARAVIEALKAMPTEPEPAPSDVARACAKAFANANPSTMAALVAGGLLAGSKVWVGCEDITAVEAEAFIRAAASSISHRGKSQVGDKTILDAMVPPVDSLARSIEANPAVAQDSALAAAALDSAIADAGEAVVATRDLQSQRGCASWLQDRSIGLQDPGATAFLRALEAWRDASTGARGPRAAVVENL